MTEQEVCFKRESDLMVYSVTTEDESDTLAEISGYDLKLRFNMRQIRTLEEAEDAAKSMSNLFLKLLLEQLILEQPEG